MTCAQRRELEIDACLHQIEGLHQLLPGRRLPEHLDLFRAQRLHPASVACGGGRAHRPRVTGERASRACRGRGPTSRFVDPESDVDARASCPVPYRSDFHEALLERRETVRSELATLDARIRALSRVARRERLRRFLPWPLLAATVLVFLSMCVAFFVATLPRLGGSRVEQARTDAQSVRSAVEMHLAQNPDASCPTVGQLVSERILSTRSRTVDPWDGMFAVTCVGEDVTVTSAGPDRSWGTEDDIQ